MLQFCLFCIVIAGFLPVHSLNIRRSIAARPTLPPHLSNCDRDPFSECRKFLPSDKLKGIPSADELKESCPGLLQFANCMLDFLNECSSLMEGMAFEYLKEQFSFVGKMCNPESSLHIRYVANAECLKTIDILKADRACTKSSRDIYAAYRTSPQVNLPVLPEYTEDDHSLCLVNTLSITCLANEARKECGNEAFFVALDVLKEMKMLNYSCSLPLKDEAKGAFLNTLPIDEEDRSEVATAFQHILQRRKRSPPY